MIDAFKNMKSLEEYLYTVPRARTQVLRKEDLSLSPIRKILKDVGNPHKAFPIIFVWGTSGKGSTVTFLSSILKASGLRVGQILSPHVDNIRERCQVNGQWISANAFLHAGNTILGAVERRTQKHPSFKPSFFEVITAMEFWALKSAGVDIAVVEVGLGGAMDATAICPRILSILTNLDLEHRNVLGYTLSQTARNESALITSRIPLITQETKPVALRIIQSEAQKKYARLIVVPHVATAKIASATLRETVFDAKTPQQHYHNIRLQLTGQYQVLNALTAIVASEELRRMRFPITEKSVRKGLANAFIPGRFEVRSEKPLLVFDGAHNPAKARALTASWKALLPTVRPTIVLTVKPKKDVRGIVQELKTLTHQWVVTQVPDDAMIAMDRLEKTIASLDPTARVRRQADPAVALKMAMQNNAPVLVTGSLYLVSFLRQHLK